MNDEQNARDAALYRALVEALARIEVAYIGQQDGAHWLELYDGKLDDGETILLSLRDSDIARQIAADTNAARSEQ